MRFTKERSAFSVKNEQFTKAADRCDPEPLSSVPWAVGTCSETNTSSLLLFYEAKCGFTCMSDVGVGCLERRGRHIRAHLGE